MFINASSDKITRSYDVGPNPNCLQKFFSSNKKLEKHIKKIFYKQVLNTKLIKQQQKSFQVKKFNIENYQYF